MSRVHVYSVSVVSAVLSLSVRSEAQVTTLTCSAVGGGHCLGVTSSVATGAGGSSVYGTDTTGSQSNVSAVYGTSQYNVGVDGNSATGTGVLGTVTGGTGYTSGVHGTGNWYGVRGDSLPAVSGCVSAPSGGVGVYGTSQSAPGVWGASCSSVGVTGYSSTQYGVNGWSGTSDGVYGNANGTGYGVHGSSAGGAGVYGTSTSTAATSAGVSGFTLGTSYAPGVLGITASTAPGAAGVLGKVQSGTYSGVGVEGQTTNGKGVYGQDLGNGYGVYGESSTQSGVYGHCVMGGAPGVQGSAGPGNNGVGVQGDSTNGYAVIGWETGSGVGTYGYSAGGYGLFGLAGSTTSHQGSVAATGVYAEGNGYASFGVNARTMGSDAYSAAINATSGGGASWAGYFNGNVGVSGEIFVGSCSGCTSDLRLKKDVEPLTGARALDQVLRLHGVTFGWKDPSAHEDHKGTQTGFIAQDVEKVFPEWVKQDGYTGPDGTKYRTLELRQIEALEVEAIRALKEKNDALEARLRALETERTMQHAGFTRESLWTMGGMALLCALVASRRRSQPSTRA